MDLLKLTDEYDMAIERHEKKARLVIYLNGVENVCRKGSIGQIERFFSSGDRQLFKGRLQLHKREGDLSIEVKGKSIAVVKNGKFLEFLRG